MRLHQVRRQVYLKGSGVVLFGGFAAVLYLCADRFDMLEIRQPLVELVVRSGWSYVPVL